MIDDARDNIEKLRSLQDFSFKEQQYDKLAAGLRASLDMKRIYRILNGEE